MAPYVNGPSWQTRHDPYIDYLTDVNNFNHIQMQQYFVKHYNLKSVIFSIFILHSKIAKTALPVHKKFFSALLKFV